MSAQQTSSSSSESSSLGGLEDFLQLDEEPSTSATAGASTSSSQAAAAGADGNPTAYSLLQDSSSSSAAAAAAADLAIVMPQVTLTAQRLQAQLLQLLQRHDYSVGELLQLLLQGVDQAEAFYQQQIAGTELERRLLLARSDDSSSSSSAAAAAAAAGDGAAAEVEAGEGEGVAGVTKEKPFWLDFDRQREAYRQLVETLEPLFDLTVTGATQAGAQLAAKVRRQLDAITASAAKSSSSSSIEAPAAAVEAAEGAGEGAEAAGEQQEGGGAGGAAGEGGVDALRGLLDGVEASVKVSAFNQLDLTRRRQLLEVLPEIRIDLNVKGTDIRLVGDGGMWEGLGGRQLAWAGMERIEKLCGCRNKGERSALEAEGLALGCDTSCRN